MEVLTPVLSAYYDPHGWVQITEEDGSYFDDKPVVTDPMYGMIVNYSHYPRGFVKKYHRHTMSHAVYVIDGVHSSEGKTYGSGSLVLDPEGYACAHGATPDSDCKFIWITNKAGEIEFLNEECKEQKTDRQVEVVNVYCPEGWEKVDGQPEGLEIKHAFKDTQTGASLTFFRFPAGYCGPEYTIPVNTGLFVIQGELSSDLYSLKKNDLIWLPEGYRRRWQAGNRGCLLLRIQNS